MALGELYAVADDSQLRDPDRLRRIWFYSQSGKAIVGLSLALTALAFLGFVFFWPWDELQRPGPNKLLVNFALIGTALLLSLFGFGAAHFAKKILRGVFGHPIRVFLSDPKACGFALATVKRATQFRKMDSDHRRVMAKGVLVEAAFAVDGVPSFSQETLDLGAWLYSRTNHEKVWVLYLKAKDMKNTIVGWPG